MVCNILTVMEFSDILSRASGPSNLEVVLTGWRKDSLGDEERTKRLSCSDEGRMEKFCHIDLLLCIVSSFIAKLKKNLDFFSWNSLDE